MGSFGTIFTIRCAAMAGLGLTAGCSTVSSVDLSKNNEKAWRGAYLNYSVPRSLFTVQISVATGSSQAPVTSAPAAPSATLAAAAASTATPATAATSPTPSIVPADSSQCAILTAEYTAAQTEAADAISSYGTLGVRLAMMAAGAPATKDTPKLLATDTATYVKLVSSDEYHVMMSENSGRAGGAVVDGIYDTLVRDCKPRVAVGVQQTIVPDPSRTFALKPQTNILYSDSLQIGVDANGFLTNGAPTSISQVTAIASAIASDVGLAMAPETSELKALDSVQNLVSFMIIRTKKASKPAPACVPTKVDTLKEQIADLALCDPAKPDDVIASSSLARQIRMDLTKPGSLQNLPATTLPRTYYLTLDDFDPKGGAFTGAGRTDNAATDLTSSFGLTLNMTCSPRGKSDQSGRLNGTLENAPKEDKGAYDGIVVSASRACQLRSTQSRSAAQAGSAQTIVVAQNSFWAQDSRYLTILPTRRGFLVARSVGYTFANGQPTGATDSRPSEALAVVSFPGAVIGAFFGGIASGVTDKQAFKTGKTSDLNAQATYLNAQASVLNAQAALAKAKSGASGSTP